MPALSPVLNRQLSIHPSMHPLALTVVVSGVKNIHVPNNIVQVYVKKNLFVGSSFAVRVYVTALFLWCELLIFQVARVNPTCRSRARGAQKCRRPCGSVFARAAHGSSAPCPCIYRPNVVFVLLFCPPPVHSILYFHGPLKFDFVCVDRELTACTRVETRPFINIRCKILLNHTD